MADARTRLQGARALPGGGRGAGASRPAQPDEPEILVEYAEALALLHGRNLAGAPIRLVERALKIEPDNQKALTLAGSAAFEAQDYKRAIEYWQRLQKQVKPDSELGQALQAGIAQALALAGQTEAAAAPKPRGQAGAEAIRGEVKLSAALKERALPDDTVFIFARAAQGPPMPLAVIKKQVKDLPLRFTLDDTLAMAPDMKLSSFPQVVVSARVSKSGGARAQSGTCRARASREAWRKRRLSVIDSVVQ